MRADRRIGIVGASGAVGRTAVGMLQYLEQGGLRLGARRVGNVDEIAATDFGAGGEVRFVDADQPESLDRFCDGCSVVINCAAPGSRELVATSALAAGAHYVDPGGDEAFLELIQSGVRPGQTALLGAGAMPGVSGLLPRWMASQGFARSEKLTAYVASMDHLTPGAAVEFVQSIGGPHGSSRAAWS